MHGLFDHGPVFSAVVQIIFQTGWAIACGMVLESLHDSPYSGHYRAFLVRREGCWHATDDDVCSFVATSDDFSNLWKNSYLFFAIRDTEFASLDLRRNGPVAVRKHCLSFA